MVLEIEDGKREMSMKNVEDPVFAGIYAKTSKRFAKWLIG
jgi:hypothetical protein